MITADQLVVHAFGDYILQSDWMATTKTSVWKAAVAHVVLYAVPFLLLTQSPLALAVIAGTHLVIDHWRLARYVGWAKNFLAPRSAWPPPFEQCKATGYSPDKPPFMAVWLMIIVDQLMHVVINALAIVYL